MTHVLAVINRLDIPEGKEVSFGLELSFDGGKTWGECYIDTRFSPTVVYSGVLTGGASKYPTYDMYGGTLSSRGTDIPDGVDVKVRTFCSDNVKVSLEWQ